jgi:NTE family protein
LFNQVCKLRLHRIVADEATFNLRTANKLAPEWAFLLDLHDQGQRAADAWLMRHRDNLGQRSTLDLESLT